MLQPEPGDDDQSGVDRNRVVAGRGENLDRVDDREANAASMQSWRVPVSMRAPAGGAPSASSPWCAMGATWMSRLGP